MKKIIHKLFSFYHFLPAPEDKKVWIFLALVIKSIFFYLFAFVQKGSINVAFSTFARITNDSVSYIQPFESLIASGEYAPDYRMPGYGWLYYLLRLFFFQNTALNIIPFIQLLVAVLSVYVLAIMVRNLFKSNGLFYLTFLIYLISYNVSLYDNYILTESFTLSSLIFSIYFFIRGCNKKINYFYSGLFLTWAVFMRPVAFPLIFFFLLYILIVEFKLSKRTKNISWKSIIYFIIPYVLVQGAWTIRNYYEHNRLFFLTKTMYVETINDTYHKSVFEFCKAIGVSQNGWEPDSEYNFFHPEKIFNNQPRIKFSNEIFTSKFNMDSLLNVRAAILQHQDSSISIHQKKVLDARITNALNSYSQSVKSENPYLYYVKSRINILKLFFCHTGVYNLFNRTTNELSKTEILIKAFYSLLYLSVVYIGLIGLFIMFIFNFKSLNHRFFISSVGLYLVFIHPLVLKMDEYRYIMPAYPFLVIGMAYVIYKLLNFIKKI